MQSCTAVGRRRRPAPADRAVVDLGRALELLAAAAAGAPERQGLARAALSLGGHVGDDDLALVREIDIRALSAARRLPVQLTLGAAVVLDAAQRSQDRGDTRSQALERATEAAIGFLELVPERILTAASAPQPAVAGRIRHIGHDRHATTPTQKSITTTEEATRDES